MRNVSHVLRRRGVDGLIVLAALVAALEVVLLDDPSRMPETPLSFAVPAVALTVLLLLGRRRYPFRFPRGALAGR